MCGTEKNIKSTYVNTQLVTVWTRDGHGDGHVFAEGLVSYQLGDPGYSYLDLCMDHFKTQASENIV